MAGSPHETNLREAIVGGDFTGHHRPPQMNTVGRIANPTIGLTIRFTQETTWAIVYQTNLPEVTD